MRFTRWDYQSRIKDQSLGIPDDEPVALFRGQDLAAPAALDAWAADNERRGGDIRLSAQMRTQANAMRAWHTHKLADVPPRPAPAKKRKPRPRTGPSE